MQRVYKRGDTYWGVIYQDGKRVRRSTRCRDRRAAEAVVAQWEREAADPAAAAQDQATLGVALDSLLDSKAADVEAGRRAKGTLHMYRVKAGHLRRVLEHGADSEAPRTPLPLKRLSSALVDGYVSTRHREGAAAATIAKELVTLRVALQLAIRAGLWAGQVDAVVPEGDHVLDDHHHPDHHHLDHDHHPVHGRGGRDHGRRGALVCGRVADRAARALRWRRPRTR